MMLTKIHSCGDKLSLYIPKKEQIYQKGDSVLVTIKKNSKEVRFISRFNHNITVRTNFVNFIGLKKHDYVHVTLKKIKNVPRKKNLFFKGKIDMLSLIPEKTSRSFEIIVYPFMKNQIKLLKTWYCHNRGSGCQLELRRFVDIDKFGRLLGQYQAEGTKHNGTCRKFHVQFANKLLAEHVDFLSYLELLGLSREMVEFRLIYNPNKYPKKSINLYLKRFKQLINLNLRITIDPTNRGFGLFCIIRNVLLTEILLHSMNRVRKSLATRKSYTEDQKILVGAFFAKLLTGDGTMDIRTKNREYDYPTTRIRIVDQNKEYLEDYKNIMDRLGFKTKINFEHIFVRAHCGFHQMIYLYQIGAFKNTNNWNKILVNIDLLLKGKRTSTLRRYFDLVKLDRFNTSIVASKSGLNISGAYDWLKRAVTRNYVIKISCNNYPVRLINWKTTSKAEDLVDALKLWQGDFLKLHRRLGIKDSINLLESLKTKHKSPTYKLLHSSLGK